MIPDIVVLTVLLVSAVIAFLRGFIREVLTILGVAGGLVAAWFGGPVFSPIAAGWFDAGTEEEPKKLFDMIPYDMVADAIAYGSIFIIVVIVLSIASHLLAGWARAVGLGAVDRTLGVIFGIARGVVIIALLYLPLSIIAGKETMKEWFGGSRTHVFVAATADWMMTLVPESFREDAADKAEETADSMAKATREKLQELEVLGGAPGAEKLKEQEQAGPPAPGYEKDERRNMDRLIEDNFNE